MFCTNCGTKLDGSFKFCGSCGKPVLPEKVFPENAEKFSNIPEEGAVTVVRSEIDSAPQIVNKIYEVWANIFKTYKGVLSFILVLVLMFCLFDLKTTVYEEDLPKDISILNVSSRVQKGPFYNLVTAYTITVKNNSSFTYDKFTVGIESPQRPSARDIGYIENLKGGSTVTMDATLDVDQQYYNKFEIVPYSGTRFSLAKIVTCIVSIVLLFVIHNVPYIRRPLSVRFKSNKSNNIKDV